MVLVVETDSLAAHYYLLVISPGAISVPDVVVVADVAAGAEQQLGLDVKSLVVD